MNDLALAIVTIGGAGLLDDEWPRPARDRSPSPAASSRRPGAEPATPTMPRTFDAIFALHGQGLPVPYLRALAWNESRLDPKTKSKKSSATGLLQVIDVVRTDHNRIHGTSYTREDLVDPVVNVTIAASAIRRIADSYARNHRDVPNLLEDWNNYRFVELLTFGWNAGWSQRAGVGRVADYLKRLGTTDITVELVHQHARAAGGNEYLQSDVRLAWAKKVARHYAAERADDASLSLVARNAGRNTEPDIATRRLRIQRLMGTDDTKGVRGDLALARRAKANGRTLGWEGNETIDEAIARHEGRLAMWQAKLDELDELEGAAGSPPNKAE